MPVALDDILQAVWKSKHTDPNTIMVQAFYYKASNVVDGDEANVQLDMEQQHISLFENIQTSLSNRYEMTAVRVTNQTQKTLIGEGPGAGFTGIGGAGEVLPAQDAALVVARSTKLGHQGRKYLGPLLEGVVDNGALLPANLANFDAFGQMWDSEWVGNVTGNTYQPGTVKFAPGGAVQEFTQFDTFLSTAYADMRTQRSRRPGVGLG